MNDKELRDKVLQTIYHHRNNSQTTWQSLSKGFDDFVFVRICNQLLELGLINYDKEWKINVGGVHELQTDKMAITIRPAGSDYIENKIIKTK
jgi:hypothetical protein